MQSKTKNGILHLVRLRFVMSYLRLALLLSHGFKMPVQLKNALPHRTFNFYNITTRRQLPFLQPIKLFLQKSFELNLIFVEMPRINIPGSEFLVRDSVGKPCSHHLGYGFALLRSTIQRFARPLISHWPAAHATAFCRTSSHMISTLSEEYAMVKLAHPSNVCSISERQILFSRQALFAVTIDWQRGHWFEVTFVSTDFGDACFDTGALYDSKPKSTEPERSSVISRGL